MTAAVFARVNAAPNSRLAKIGAYGLVAAAVVALSALWQFRIGLWGDVVWLLMLDDRWFAGERPYIDFLEINPPASLIVYAPEVALAHVLGVTAEAVVVATGFVVTALSFLTACAIFNRAARLAEIGLVGFATALLALFFLPGDAFMERDVLVVVFVAPYLALAEARAARAPVALWHAVAAGLGVGLMVALKPPYALCAGLPTLYILWKAGPRALFDMVEIPVALLVAGAYAYVAWRYFPAYAQNMLPALIDVYLVVRQSAFELIHSAGGLDFLALMLVGAYLGREELGEPALAVSALAAIGAFVGYWAQGKGWLYQAYPALAFAALFAGRAFERSKPLPGDAAFAIVAFATALGLGLTIPTWGSPLIFAAAIAFTLRRLWIGATNDLLPALARLIAAAAFGATVAAFVPGEQPSDALGRALTRLGPHPTVVGITESFGYVHPMVRRFGAQWVQSVPDLVITSGARLLIDEKPNDAALAARLAPYIEADRKRLVADILGKKPDAIIVGPLNTRFHAALWGDPELQAALRDYRLFAVNDVADKPGELWARRDIVNLRKTLAPNTLR